MKSILCLLVIVPTIGLGACSSKNPGIETREPTSSACDDGEGFDCAGECNGPALFDCAGVCGGMAILDCAGECDGTAIEDCAGECNGLALFDCAGECGGTAIEDCAGECGGPAIEDCAGVCGGTAVEDCAGECNGPAHEDCAGKCGGASIVDCEGVCDGPALEDCAGVCNGPALEDCAGVCEGGAVEDACGICGGTMVEFCCPPPVISHEGTNEYTGQTESYLALNSEIKFDNEFSFAGWVRFNEWTGSYNRVFDFGRQDSLLGQSMRLHRNGGTTFRMSFNDWDLFDVSGYWPLGTFVFVTVTVDSTGIWTVYKDGVAVASQYVAPCSNITWSDEPNYYVAKSNWFISEPNSDVTVHNLRWYDTVIDSQCMEQLFTDAP